MGMTKIWEGLYLGSLKDAAELAADNPTKCRERQRGLATFVSQ
jgi:hypothetical protein